MFFLPEVLKIKAHIEKRRGYYLLLALALFLVPLYLKAGSNLGSIYNHQYTVLNVVDGDTIILEGVDAPVRYLGIDAPEVLTEDSPGDILSLEAKILNEDLVYQKKVELEYDEEKYDPYGRMLAYVRTNGVFVNKELVANGLARAFIIDPNDKYEKIIYEAEEEAKRQKKGIWGGRENLRPPDENARFLIKPGQAGRHIGQRVVVRGKITDFRKSDKVTVLKMEGEMDIVIFSGDWRNFNFFGIAPEKYYLGKPLEVIGRVKMYRGNPQIVVGHPISMRVIR